MNRFSNKFCASHNALTKDNRYSLCRIFFILAICFSATSAFAQSANYGLVVSGVYPRLRVDGPGPGADVALSIGGNGDVQIDGPGLYAGRLVVKDTSGFVGIGTPNPQTLLQVAGVISPSADNTYTLGSSAYRFTSIYATNSVINTSDAREKKTIETSDLGLDFINRLRPVSYYWKSGEDTNLHYGLIAQEVQSVISDSKKNSVVDASNVIVAHDKKTDRYGIKYTELISPMIKAIQELTSQVSTLKEQNATLGAQNAALLAYICTKDEAASICKH